MSIRKKEDDPLFVRGNIVKSSHYGYAILILGMVVIRLLPTVP